MKTIEAIIERGSDGTFGIYLGDNDLSYSIIGDGETVDAALTDFKNSYSEMRDHYKEIGKEFEEVVFEFKYDMSSFLEYYSKVFSLAGLSRLTGVNQGQLSHYLTGHRKPSPKTVLKIETSLHEFAKEISQVEFA
ncbi:helix-turn-helix protein [Dysgonomonas alginatilytica]|uniref:Helix-turn-helix protein n=1 Tax=Dysgonomonas alginatilytica TaxID=1605892 RepID=A0A2V3PJ37_9BACT|nr:helix-turn-helix transcriptional regulator [Dysgonomonas alginatilytica]PXV60167.1 helix-turn-helix protein [Dysgonomonas alginatilytica]